MKKLLIISLLLLVGSNGFGQKDSITFSIDPTIKTIVESKINDSLFTGLPMRGMLTYMNPIIINYWENDSLIISRTDENKGLIFKSFYYQMEDTLVIDGAFGMFGGSGFSIKFINDKPYVYHMLASDETPSYTKTINGELKHRIEVPCRDVKLTISSIPTKNDTANIYGIVSFTSNEYYHSAGTSNGEEIKPRVKIKAYMKIYFKSGFLDIEKLK